MNDQSQTTANAPSEPKLCKMGCGFFGNAATNDCCSKCFRDMQKSKVGGQPQSGDAENKNPSEPAKAPTVQPTQAMPNMGGVVCPVVTEKNSSASSQPAPKKRSKKKSYKAMMAGMMEGKASSRDAEQEKEQLRQVTGGGTFSKVDKI